MAAATASPVVDTASVANRRQVKFNNHDEVLADIERLAGGYQQLGNCSLGKIAKHLSEAMATGLDGPSVRASLPMRLVARYVFKNKAVRGPMRPGFKLPAKFVPSLMPDVAGDQEGIAALRQTIRRWKTEKQRHPHGFFGHLTDDEWERLMLNHAAMHMSFFLPKPPANK